MACMAAKNVQTGKEHRNRKSCQYGLQQSEASDSNAGAFFAAVTTAMIRLRIMADAARRRERPPGA